MKQEILQKKIKLNQYFGFESLNFFLRDLQQACVANSCILPTPDIKLAVSINSLSGSTLSCLQISSAKEVTDTLGSVGSSQVSLYPKWVLINFLFNLQPKVPAITSAHSGEILCLEYSSIDKIDSDTDGSGSQVPPSNNLLVLCSIFNKPPYILYNNKITKLNIPIDDRLMCKVFKAFGKFIYKDKKFTQGFFHFSTTSFLKKDLIPNNSFFYTRENPKNEENLNFLKVPKLNINSYNRKSK